MSSNANPKDLAVANALPLSTLLSQLLIAFAIEFDNEFEHQSPHRTTSFGVTAQRGPWLGSMVLWANAMRLVPEEGITVAELQNQARTESLQLNGLERWGYIVVAPDPSDTRPKPPHRDWLVFPTRNGRRAQEVWRPLGEIIEARWRERFGQDIIHALRKCLCGVLGRIDLALPEFLPIVGYGLFSPVLLRDSPTPGMHSEEALARMNLSALLAKVLLAFTLAFESDWKFSLPVSANVLRVLHSKGVRIADLPRLTGVAKEGVAFATGWLERGGYAVIQPDPAAKKGNVILLTSRGEVARQACNQRLEAVEARWQERFGNQAILALRETLSAILYETEREQPLLAQGLIPYPAGWRARKPYVTQTLAFIADPAGSLPHFPMVLHRGGYPDGS